jgi:hypothetical protein
MIHELAADMTLIWVSNCCNVINMERRHMIWDAALSSRQLIQFNISKTLSKVIFSIELTMGAVEEIHSSTRKLRQCNGWSLSGKMLAREEHCLCPPCQNRHHGAETDFPEKQKFDNCVHVYRSVARILS